LFAVCGIAPPEAGTIPEKHIVNEQIGQEMRKLTIQGGYHKYKEVSFLRGFAITTVVLMHVIQVYWHEGQIPAWLRAASAMGGTGGHVFIFCSGLGLYLSYLHRPMGFGEFIRKRFLKIYIPYLIFLLIHFFLPHWNVDDRTQLEYLLSHVFLYKMFFEKYILSYGLQLWFISTIIQLYLLFLPLCKLREKTSIRTVLLAGCAVSVGWWIAMHATGLEVLRIWGSFCFQYLWEFVLGMAIADYLMTHDTLCLPAWSLMLAAVCGLVLAALMVKLGGYWQAFNDVPALVGYMATVLLLYAGGRHVLRPLFLWIDGFSYEWFLVHVDGVKFGYYYIDRWIPDESPELIRVVFAFLFSLAAALMLRLLVRGVNRLLRLDGGRSRLPD